MMRATSRPFHVGWKRLYFGLPEDRVLPTEADRSDKRTARDCFVMSQKCRLFREA